MKSLRRKFGLIFAPGLILAVLGGVLVLTSCDKVESSAIAKRAGLYHQLVRTFITDPVVLPLFSEDQLDELRRIESTYLSAIDILKKGGETTDTLQAILLCSDEVCAVLGKLELPEHYQKQLSIIRAGLLALRMGITMSGGAG